MFAGFALFVTMSRCGALHVSVLLMPIVAASYAGSSIVACVYLGVGTLLDNVQVLLLLPQLPAAAVPIVPCSFLVGLANPANFPLAATS